MRITTTTLTTLLATAAAAISLAACHRPDDGHTAGERLDGAVASAERKADEVRADLGRAAERAKQATSNAADAIADKTKDAAITTSINAELAKDAQLSALRIDVDTSGGRVVLNGTALDASSRERAERLAMAVDGVRSVENQLLVRARQ